MSSPKPKPKPEITSEHRLANSRGGRIGGKARAASLTPEQRKEIAKKAAEARWSSKKVTTLK
jgi:hypothetical protein